MGIEINRETLDYLKQQIAGEVREKVEKDIFGYYRKWIAVVTGVLGLVGVTFGWSSLRSFVERTAETETARQITRAMDEHRTQIARATADATNARDISFVIRTVLEDRKNEFIQHFAKTAVQVDDLRGEIAKNVQTQNRLTDDVSRVRLTFEGLAGANGKFVTLREMEPITLSIAQIVDRLAAIEAALPRNPASPRAALPPPRSGDNPFAGLDLGPVQVQAMATQKRIDDAKALPRGLTVYVQFAGAVSRDDVRKLSSSLIALGWIVPGEERTPKAAGLSELRCFFADDCEKAEQLRTDLASALEAQGLSAAGLAVSRLLGYPAKPRPGILEVWIEPRRR